MQKKTSRNNKKNAGPKISLNVLERVLGYPLWDSYINIHTKFICGTMILKSVYICNN